MPYRALVLLGPLLGCQPESKINPIDEAEPTEEQSPPEEEAPQEEVDIPTRAVEQGTSADPGAAHVPGEDLPDDYIYDEETVEPLLTAADVEAGIEEGLETVFWVDPALLHETYNDLIETSKSAVVAGEDDCPYYYDYYLEDYGYFYWYDTCTADDDTAYSGYTLGYYYSGMESGSYLYDNYSYLSGTGAVSSPEGYTLDIGGYSYVYEYHYAGYYSYHYSYVYGNFASDDPALADTWLAAGLSLNLTWSADHYDDVTGPQNTMTFTGSLAGMTGNVNTIVMTDTYIYTNTRGSNCEAEPSGTISVRDSAGEWYDVSFQGPPYAGASIFPPDCDGCGQIYFRGQYLGDACPDFSLLTDWEYRPW